MRILSNRLWGIALVGCGIACCAGCSSEIVELPRAAQDKSGGGAPPAPQPAAPGAVAAAPRAGAAAPAGGIGQPAAAPAAVQPAPRLPNVPPVLASDPDEKGPDALGPEGPAGNREEAMAGVGAKGRGYGGGIVTEPIRQKFTIEQRLIFQVQIPEALKLYKAEHNDQAPKTHEAFMKEIIEANSIVLPQLPEGDKYLFDPKLEKLMVLHPPE
jgi:hypothetical protein